MRRLTSSLQRLRVMMEYRVAAQGIDVGSDGILDGCYEVEEIKQKCRKWGADGLRLEKAALVETQLQSSRSCSASSSLPPSLPAPSSLPTTPRSTLSSYRRTTGASSLEGPSYYPRVLPSQVTASLSQKPTVFWSMVNT